MIIDHKDIFILEISRFFNIDFIKNLSDLKNDETKFPDAGRSLMFGYNGVNTMDYAYNKLRKID